mgnify:CR=1 FL=1
MLETRVSDTGIGISDEKKKNLFKICAAWDGAKDEENKFTSGIGLGLTNSKILCEFLGGSISVWSEVDIGTVVNFETQVGLVDAADFTVSEEPSGRLTKQLSA